MFRLSAFIVLFFTTCLPKTMAQTAIFDQPFRDTVVCHGKIVTLNFTTNGPFQPGNIFTAQLSDATGNFNNPTDIGSVATELSGTITVTFPTMVSIGSKYRVRLVSSSPLLLSPDNGVDIRIEHVPNPPIISSNSPVCEHDTLEVKVINAGTVQTDSIVWYGGIFTIPVPAGGSISHNSTPLWYSGTYNVFRVDKESKCASDTISPMVYVQPLPAKPLVSAASTPVCEGSPLQLNAITTPAAQGYAWNGPAGFMSNTQAPYIPRITASGEGWYKAYSVENGCYSGMYDSVWIDVIPTPKLTLSTNSPVCEGGELSASASDTGAIAYTWKGPNGFQVSDSAPRIPNAKTSASGMYFIHTIRNGCNGIDSINLRVKPYPYPTVLNTNSPVCEGDTLRISPMQIIQPGVVSYQFYDPKGDVIGAAGPTVPNVTKAAEGKYLLKADIEGCSRTDSVLVVVKPTPAVTTNKEFMVTVQQPVQLLASSTIPGTSFHWQGPNSFSSSEQNPTIPYVTERNTGTYTLTGTYDGCSSDTSTEVGIWYPTDFTLFEIIPNPNRGTFNLVGRVKKSQAVEIAIYHGGSGIALYKDKIQSNGKLIDTSITLHDHLAPGEYILKARADGEVQGVKFLIIH